MFRMSVAGDDLLIPEDSEVLGWLIVLGLTISVYPPRYKAC